MSTPAPFSVGVFEARANQHAYKGYAVSRHPADFYEPGRAKGGLYGWWRNVDARFDLTRLDRRIGVTSAARRVGEKAQGGSRAQLERPFFFEIFGPRLLRCPWKTTVFSVAPDVKDAWGLPVVRLTYQDHPDDLKLRLVGARVDSNCSTPANANKMDFPIDEHNSA